MGSFVKLPNTVYNIDIGRVLPIRSEDAKFFGYVYDSKRGYHDFKQVMSEDPLAELDGIKKKVFASRHYPFDRNNYYVVITRQGSKFRQTDEIDYFPSKIVYYEGLENGVPFVIEGAKVENELSVKVSLSE